MKTPAELAISTARRIDTVNSFGVCITERRNNALMAAKIQQHSIQKKTKIKTLDPKNNQNKLIKITEFSFICFIVDRQTTHGF
ncbi:hypothetical protein KAM622c_55430 (plasmid) [Klebsiella quasipneumoniae subsp. quasipneumoniae]|nr:hypothetical protein KAM622c_55430 [Klebsiella quasipneumoniae subsp. quasipneumoniae]